MIIELKPNQQLEELFNQYNKVLVDVYATWCGPCKMLATQIDAFAKNHDDWTIVRVDCDKNQMVPKMFNVQAVPTMIIVVNKEVKETIVGFKPLVEIEKITSKY